MLTTRHRNAIRKQEQAEAKAKALAGDGFIVHDYEITADSLVVEVQNLQGRHELGYFWDRKRQVWS